MGVGVRGRGSELRVKMSSGNYVKVPGCQSIQINDPPVGTLDNSDQDTLPGVVDLLPGDVSEGSLEVGINFNLDEPTHLLFWNNKRSGTTVDLQVRAAGPANKRLEFTATIRSLPLDLSKDGLQRINLSLGVGDFGAWVADS